MLSKRDSLRNALLRQRAALVLLDLGTTPDTTISRIAYKRLLGYRSIEFNEPINLLHKPLQLVEPDESFLQRLRIDTRTASRGHPWVVSTRELSKDCFMNECGIMYQPGISGAQLFYYYAISSPHLRGTSVKLKNHHWPDPKHPNRTSALQEAGTRLKDQDQYLVVGHHGDTNIFETASDLRGMADCMMDLMRHNTYIHAHLEKITNIQWEDEELS